MTQIAHLPYQGKMAGFRRFTVAEYHRLIELGILTEDDNLELLDGYLVHKMSRNPPHDAAIQKGTKRWLRLLPAGWDLRVQSATRLRQAVVKALKEIHAILNDDQRGRLAYLIRTGALGI